MLTVLTHCSWITGRVLHPLGVEFVYPDPLDPRPHNDAFRCPLRFGQGANRALLSTADLALPLSGRNTTLATVHEKLAKQRLHALILVGRPFPFCQSDIFEKAGTPGQARGRVFLFPTAYVQEAAREFT